MGKTTSRGRKKVKAQPAPLAPPCVVSARGRWVSALVVFVAVFTVYVFTTIPTMVDQDSGELVAAAHVLGVAHPTGYPLWTMLARAFDFLPIGHTSAYRVALLSAASAAGGAAVICWLTISLTGLLLPGVFAGLSFGFWFPTWSQAVLAEVYGLAGLLFTLFLLALWRWDGDRSPKHLWWVALAGGFVAMHHRTAVLAVGPSLAVAFWLTRPRRARVWVPGAALFLAPFLCYLYLPIRAAARPAMNWGNPDTLGRFLHHAMGRQYTFLALSNSFEVAMEQAVKLLGESLAGAGWLSLPLAMVGVPLIVWGLASWYRRRGAVVGSLATGCVVLCGWVLEWGDTSDLKVFLTPLGAVVALFGGLGLAKVSALLPKRKAGRFLAAGMGALVCAILLSANWEASDQSNTWRHRDRWVAALSQMDKNAIFVAESDPAIFATYYLQNVEGMRRDIAQLAPQGLSLPWAVEAIPDRELGSTAKELWSQITTEANITRSYSPDCFQGAALLAHRLAQRYRGRRAIYALHGEVTGAIPRPPYFVSLSQDLVKVDYDLPEDLLERVENLGTPLVELAGGVKLMSFELSKREAHTGELVDFRARWRLETPLSGGLFGLKLVPTHVRNSAGGGGSQMEWERWSEKGKFVQGFPLVYGLIGISSSPPGTVYEQKGKLIIPSNAPAGGYGLEIGFSPSNPPDYQGWADLGREEWLVVHPRPLPTNRP